MYGPLLKGSNFLLRPPRLEDAIDMIGWFEKMEITRKMPLRFPLSLEQEEGWLKEKAADPNTVLWTIDASGILIGTTCIEQIDWHNRRGITGTLIGRSESWGQGIGGELMHLRADFAFTQLPLNKLSSAYLEGNEASRRAQLAAGYKEIGRCRQEFFREGRWVDRVLTELLREEWLTLQDDR